MDLEKEREGGRPPGVRLNFTLILPQVVAAEFPGPGFPRKAPVRLNISTINRDIPPQGISHRNCCCCLSPFAPYMYSMNRSKASINVFLRLGALEAILTCS